MSALHFASRAGHSKICQHLLDVGANADLPDRVSTRWYSIIRIHDILTRFSQKYIFGLQIDRFAEHYAANQKTAEVFRKHRKKSRKKSTEQPCVLVIDSNEDKVTVPKSGSLNVKSESNTELCEEETKDKTQDEEDVIKLRSENINKSLEVDLQSETYKKGDKENIEEPEKEPNEKEDKKVKKSGREKNILVNHTFEWSKEFTERQKMSVYERLMAGAKK